MNYRKSIQDKIITDLKALTHTGGGVIFADVKKIFKDIPTSLPAGILLNTGTQIEILGNEWDSRNLQFELNVMEVIEGATSQTEAELRIDRLSNIEDIVLNYLEKLPNNLENDISGIHVTDIVIDSVFYDYQSDERGIMLNLIIGFSTKIILEPRLV